jgi:hypothetical protein
MEGELPSEAGGLSTVLRHLLCTTVLLFGATALRADVFSFSYAGVGVSAFGTLTASAAGGGLYTVTDIVGYRNKVAITDSPLGGNLGAFYYNSSPGTPLLNAGGIIFGLNGLTGLDTVYYANGFYQESIVALTGVATNNLQTFTISRVPEPATLLLLCVMGLGVWILARKLPSKETS